MFDPVKELHNNPALFACYILFVYFRGVNAVRIEREMRSLGHTTFHRRNLYRRGKHRGWIAKYGWQLLSEPPAVAGESSQPIDTPGKRKDQLRVPSCDFVVEKEDLATNQHEPTRNDTNPDTAQSALRTPQSKDFHTWLKRVSPNMTWNWRHQQVIIEQLKKVTDGGCKRLMIFLPPRHGKSELVSVRYTAWRMQQDPSINVILGSYNQRLADKMSRKIRTVICDSFTAETPRPGELSEPPAVAGGSRQPTGIRRHPKEATSIDEQGSSPRLCVSAVQAGANPFPFARPRPKNAVSEWETAVGGSFRAVGAGSGVTGFGANLIVIDDPVKNRAQAESETFRNRVWDWYKDDLYTRLEPDGSIVLIQTRWHEDDLAGKLLRDDHDNWTIINLPALSEPGAVATGLAPDAVAESTETGHPLSVQPAVAGGSTQPIETSGGNASVNERGDQAPDSGSVSSVLSVVPSALTTGITEQTENTEKDHPQIDTDKHRSDRSAETSIRVHQCSSVDEISPRLSVSAVNTFDWRSAPDIALCPERFDEQALDKLKTQLGTYSFSALYQQRPTPAGGQIFKREWFKNIIDFAPPGLRWKRGYDLAVSTRTESDYTASFRCAFDKLGNLYISGGFRRRIEFPEQRRYIIDRMLTERDTEHGVELALHGQALIQDLRRDPSIRGKSLSGVKVSTDKLTRALTWSPLAEEGKVILVRSMSVPPAVAGGLTRPIATSSTPGTPTHRSKEGRFTPALSLPRGSEGKPPFPTETGCVDTEISPRPPKRHETRDKSRSADRSPVSPWISDLLDELTAFPNGSHDDQIDAISLAVQMLAKREFKARGYLIT